MVKIKQILAQEDTVLFIGSGISMWSGLPSWSRMIEELAQFVESAGASADLIREEARRGDLLQAASYGFNKLTKQQIGDFIRAACRYGVAKPHEVHRKIVTLGPSCFITTNYDNLIEESLRNWQPDRFFRPPVTNRLLTEMAEIIHARASNFIFKPHGDASDSDSIILTREQYRQLLPQGERQAALESLKMLLASRPVIYLGFGLRDPDFIYLRDLLANTYKGGTRTHYAIMPDVSVEESDYWRKNYGIHLVSYKTVERPDKTRDHTELLTLLDFLLEKKPIPPEVVDFDPYNPQVILALARHAAGLTRTPKINPEFPIRVHSETKNRTNKGTYYYRQDMFDHYTVEKFLDEGPECALLIGLPGAGKSYSLRQAAARLAEKLHETCLTDRFEHNAVVVPILADLKLYRGDLGELISQTLPKSLPLQEIMRHFKVKIFFDSFNEMPREYWESGFYETDFENFFKRVGRASIIVCSRTSDGLNRLELPLYYLDQIDEATVAAELHQLGIDNIGTFDLEIRRLLQKPFYFQYIVSGAVSLPKKAHPRDFYQAFFENLCKEFNMRFSQQIGIKKVLALTAYNALDIGEEVFLLSELLHALKRSGENLNLTDIDARDIANWLVSTSVLIPYTGGRVAFVHQSVTEYLAAEELARQYKVNPHVLKHKLKLTRWDQALFLTLSLLPSDQGEEFLQDVIKADFSLALNAAKYIEDGREEIVAKLLSQIPKRITSARLSDYSIEYAVEYGLPIGVAHEPQLRMLIKCGGSLGAAAVRRLVAIKGEEVKDELLQMLVDHLGDFNLCHNGIAPALRPFATDGDAKKIACWADSILRKLPYSNDDDMSGFIYGAAVFLMGIELSVIRREFLLTDKLMDNFIRIQIVCTILRNLHSTEALNLAGDLLLMDVPEAAAAIYFISKATKSDWELSWTSYTIAHVYHLETILFDFGDEWALRALICLCSVRSDLAEIVRQSSSKKKGIERAVLLYCVAPTDLTPVFKALEELISMCSEERLELPIRVLRGIDFDWTGKEELFVKLLKLRDVRIASVLFGGTCPPDVTNLGNLEIGPIEWWLQWMLEAIHEDEDSSMNGSWFVRQLAGLFAAHLNREVQDKFVAEFNKSDSKFRWLLLNFVLHYFSDITTDAFNKDTISFMLADLSRKRNTFTFNSHLLEWAATDQFVMEYILPMLPNAKSPLLENLHSVLKQAGSRHGKRYIIELPSEFEESTPVK